MSIRNYNAFLKAARKAGGLSFPAARKAYRVMQARMDRPLKGTDVKKHPRIFRQSIKAGIRDPKPRSKKIRGPVPVKRKAPAKRRVAPVRLEHGFEIGSIADYEKYFDDEPNVSEEEEEEYVSAVEYVGKKE